MKAREAQGYAYEAADASFELLARSVLDGVPEYFAVDSFHVSVERKVVAPGVTYSASQAVVKIRIGEERLISAAEGNGPVNALDLALRKDSASTRNISRTSNCATIACASSRAEPTP